MFCVGNFLIGGNQRAQASSASQFFPGTADVLHLFLSLLVAERIHGVTVRAALREHSVPPPSHFHQSRGEILLADLDVVCQQGEWDVNFLAGNPTASVLVSMWGRAEQRVAASNLQVRGEAELTLRDGVVDRALCSSPVRRKFNVELTDEIRSTRHIVDVTGDLV